VTNAYLICRIVDTIEDDEELPLDKKAEFLEQFIRVVSARESAEQFVEGVSLLLSESIPEAERELVRHTPVVIGGMLSLNPRQQKAIRDCTAVLARGMLDFQRKKTAWG